MCSGPFLFPILGPSAPPSSRQCPKAPEGMARERKAPRSRRERTLFSPEMRWPSGQLPVFIPSSFQGGQLGFHCTYRPSFLPWNHSFSPSALTQWNLVCFTFAGDGLRDPLFLQLLFQDRGTKAGLQVQQTYEGLEAAGQGCSSP